MQTSSFPRSRDAAQARPRSLTRRLAPLAVSALLALSMLPALADESPAATPPAASPASAPAPSLATLAVVARLEAHKEALARANAAVVGIEVMAVEDARSIATLGRQRQGSGVLIGDDGLVLTIGYLILEADHIDLVVEGGRRVPARVVAYDLASGFGLLQALAPLGLVPVTLGTSASVGDEEPVIVASGGDEGDLSLARMVSRRAFSGYWEYHIEGALFTAPARSDFSGAALFNADGELVGVGSLFVGNALGASGPALRGNMFVPVDLLKPILAEMRTLGASRSSTRAWLGVNCDEADGHVRVIRFAPDSPAEEAGLQPRDVIVAVDGVPVADLESFYRALWRGERADRDIGLDVQRGSQTLRLSVHAVDRMQTLKRPQGV